MSNTVRDIIRNHLKAIGADGLAVEGCGCGVDDLMPYTGNPEDLQ